MKKQKSAKRFSVRSSSGASDECSTLLEAVQVAFAILFSESCQTTVTIIDNFHVEPEYCSMMIFDKVPAIQSVV